MNRSEKTQEQLSRNKDQLYLEEVPLQQIANTVGTPCYVYSRAGMEKRWHAFDRAFSQRQHLVCYAVKACSNLAVLNVLASLGSGFDIVSAGELTRTIRAAGDPAKIVFSGVGKQREEIEQALKCGILCFNVESLDEIYLLEAVAQTVGKPAPIAARINFNIHVDTHNYLSTGRHTDKFGVSPQQAVELCRYAHRSRWLSLRGIACHIGSQLTQLAAFTQVCQALSDFATQLAEEGLSINHIDVGGGLGIDYPDSEPAPTPEHYIACLLKAIPNHSYKIIVEPGRAIIGPAGLLLSRVLHLKTSGQHHFAVVDAAMNDLLRPALYQANHAVCQVQTKQSLPPQTYDVVGPVCESGDVLARQQQLSVAAGDLLAILTCGAYGFSMASHYNSRPLPAEVLVDGQRFDVIRQRESIDDLISKESIPTTNSDRRGS